MRTPLALVGCGLLFTLLATTAAPLSAALPAASDPPPVGQLATGSRPTVRAGDDWAMPSWARPAPFSGFFSEEASAQVPVRSIDLTWAQIAPAADGGLDLNRTGRAQGMKLDSLARQLAEPGPYWLRLFASGTDWAPDWVRTKCGVKGIGPDYDGQYHLPIWDPCVWAALRNTWEDLLVGQGILADPDFQFAYVPGGFTWVELDYDIVSLAAQKGLVSKQRWLTWHDQMLSDLSQIAGDKVGRLVFTGEDYPWGPFGGAEDLLATDAVQRGFGIRTGITELSNFHLSETPAYGSRIQTNGHLTLTREQTEKQVFASENECYRDCGFKAKNLRYAIEASNLKALQLQLNWLYVVPTDSGFNRYPEHWNWVRLSLGQRPETSPDAWVALRDAQDTFWADQKLPGRAWTRRPWVRNLERWLTQVDVRKAVATRSTADVHRHELSTDNGIAYEGLRTNRAKGNPSLAFRVDPRFLSPTATHPVAIKVTFLDRGRSTFRLRHSTGRSRPVTLKNTGKWRTATFQLRLSPTHSLPGATDFWLDTTKSDLHVRFVRVVRLTPPQPTP